MLSLKNQIIKQKIVNLISQYSFILMFHLNPLKVKEYINLKKVLHSTKVKSPCINFPVRFFTKLKGFESIGRTLAAGAAIQNGAIDYKTNIGSKTQKVLPIDPFSGGSCFFFFCLTKEDVKTILDIMQSGGFTNKPDTTLYERDQSIGSSDFLSLDKMNKTGSNRTNSLCPFINIGMIINNQRMGHSYALQGRALTWYPEDTKSMNLKGDPTFKFLSSYETMEFININSNIFNKTISYLEYNKNILNILNGYPIYSQNIKLLLIRQMSIIKCIEFIKINAR